MSTAGPLCSPDITPVHSYYKPIRHPLVFGPFPAVYGYKTYLSPVISLRDKEGFSSCLACPYHRAVAITPLEWIAASVKFRPSTPPSPHGCRLDLQVFSLSGPPVRSLTLQPGDSLTPLKDCFVDGLQIFGFPYTCHPSYRASDYYPGRTDSC
jgi:hypothetical protein